jgi:hypothetical protein
MNWRPGQPISLTRLAVILGGLASSAAVIGIVLVAQSASDDSSREIGKWVLQVALVFAGTGVVSVVVRQAELSRARRDAWTELLHELIGAHDAAQMASRLLSAHATAKTYSEQITVLTAARGTLRRLSSAPGVHEDKELHDALLAMRWYLKRLIKEYQEKYLPVARQQRLDEAVLGFRLGKVAESDRPDFPVLPPELGQPLPAGLALQDAGRFPLLNEFRTAFKASKFREAYEVAKPIMQSKAGLVGRKSRASLAKPELSADNRS